MICGFLELENTVQVGDKTRLSAIKSFVTKGEAAVSLVEIQPEDTAGFIDITDDDPSNWFLDWIYAGITRSVTVSLRITTDGAPVVVTKTMQVNTEVDDYLFSADTDLTAIEPDVLKWVPDGRSSFLNVHRSVQEKIMDALNKMGITDNSGNPLTKAAIVDIDEVKFWSRDWTLALIYKGAQNQKEDVFDEKAKFYFGEAAKAKDRARLRLDINGDGTADNSESYDMTAVTLVRR
jgi:hypothetical protein